MIGKCIKIFCLTTITLVFCGSVGLWYLYKERTNGTIYLEGAPGVASITRETDNGIAHIRGENLQSAMYAQGFAHAQTRLWKMEATRRVFSGTAAEIFG